MFLELFATLRRPRAILSLNITKLENDVHRIGTISSVVTKLTGRDVRFTPRNTQIRG